MLTRSIHFLKQFFGRPQLKDIKLARQARLLWLLVTVINVVNLLSLGSIFTLETMEEIIFTLFFGGFTLTVCLIVYSEIHRGHFTRGAYVFCSYFAILFPLSAFAFGGIRDNAFYGAFVLITISGLLLGRRGLLIYGGSTLVSGIGLYLFEINGYLQRRDAVTTAADLIFILLMLICVMALIYGTINTLNQNYEQLVAALDRLSKTTVSKKYADNIIGSMEDMLFVVDKSMKIRTVNPIALKLLGYQNESELIGGSFRLLFLEGEAPPWVDLDDEQSSMYSFRASEHRLLTRSGELVDVSLTSSLIEYKTNEFGVVCVGHDISRQKQTEQALIEAKDTAEEIAAAKSNFLANMSHEIRTPLNAVIGMSTILQDLSLDDESREYVDIVKSSSESLLEIVNDILDFSKIDADQLHLDLQPFNLLETIEKGVDIISTKVLEKEIQFGVILDPTFPLNVIGDEVRINQILINLFSNAVKFTHEGAIIVRVFGLVTDTESVEVTIKVSDSGIGIPEHRLDAIFEPFQQADSSTTRKFGGTGLGLAITKRLIEKMGGGIEVDSVIDQGTTFTVRVPMGIGFGVDETKIKSSIRLFEDKSIICIGLDFQLETLIKTQFSYWGASVDCFSIESFQTQNRIEPVFKPNRFGYLFIDEISALNLVRESDLSKIQKVMFLPLGQKLTSAEESFGFRTLTYPLKPSHLVSIAIHPDELHQPATGDQLPDVDEPTPASLRILLVDDNVVNQKIGLKVLEKIGYGADTARDGVEAVVAARRKVYDVILMDIQMPRMNGVDASRRIRSGLSFEQQPHIIALTAESPDKKRMTELLEDMDDVLEKPIRFDDLVNALNRSAHRTKTAG